MKISPRKNRGLSRLLSFLSFLLLLPNLLPIHLRNLEESKVNWDDFTPELAERIKNVDALLAVADAEAGTKGIHTQSLPYLDILDSLVRQRFYHGYSHYSLSENWIAAFAGLFSDLSAIVIPNDVLKYPIAACSQQTIVMMECLKRKGIPFRKVGFVGHYAGEANIGGNWYYYDTNLEPDVFGKTRTSFDEILKDKRIPILYKETLDSTKIATQLVFIGYGPINAPPAPNASLFHGVTKWTSRLLWLLPLAGAFFLRRKNR